MEGINLYQYLHVFLDLFRLVELDLPKVGIMFFGLHGNREGNFYGHWLPVFHGTSAEKSHVGTMGTAQFTSTESRRLSHCELAPRRWTWKCMKCSIPIWLNHHLSHSTAIFTDVSWKFQTHPILFGIFLGECRHIPVASGGWEVDGKDIPKLIYEKHMSNNHQ